MPYQIRIATPEDARSVVDLYAPYVLDTTVSFELEVPSIDEYRGRIQDALDHRTFLVVEETASGRVVGFATWGPFGHRPAYRWSGETSIYLEQGLTGRGLGAILLDCLERIMAAAGLTNSEACICSENTGSIAFHERHGYRVSGEFVDCASKFGRWLGIHWLEKHIAPHDPDPRSPSAPSRSVCDEIVAAANERLGSQVTR
ncbi:MAG: N-acetyltransferase family protein [Collinsella sp.]|nr:N-acetyltransferase family protein [Collinsella sp.]